MWLKGRRDRVCYFGVCIPNLGGSLLQKSFQVDWLCVQEHQCVVSDLCFTE